MTGERPGGTASPVLGFGERDAGNGIRRGAPGGGAGRTAEFHADSSVDAKAQRPRSVLFLGGSDS